MKNFKTHKSYYNTYNHNANGMVILDELGIDKLVIGDPIPDPNVGPRIGPATGIAINNAIGRERSGYGLMNINGKDRMVIGLENEKTPYLVY